MKKAIVTLCALLILLTFPSAALAADGLYRMLHGDSETQDALIIGQLIDKQGDKFIVKVLQVLNGKVKADSILVADDFTYGWEKATPMVNDFGVFSLRRTGDYYKKAWGIFKTTSGEYKTLKLELLNAPIPWLLGDLACIQWYVNSGGTENDFYGNSGTFYVRRPDGSSVRIYPLPDAEKAALENKGAMSQIENKTMDTGFKVVLLFGAVALLGLGTGVFVRLRKVKR